MFDHLLSLMSLTIVLILKIVSSLMISFKQTPRIIHTNRYAHLGCVSADRCVTNIQQTSNSSRVYPRRTLCCVFFQYSPSGIEASAYCDHRICYRCLIRKGCQRFLYLVVIPIDSCFVRRRHINDNQIITHIFC